MVKLKLTPEEKNAVIKELAERMKDTIYMRAEDKAKEVIENLLKVSFEPEDPIIINYQIEMVGTDILQILGRIRRKKPQEESIRVRAVCKECGHVYSFNVTIPPSDDSCPKCGSSNYTFIKENGQRDD